MNPKKEPEECIGKSVERERCRTDFSVPIARKRRREA